MGLFKCLNFQSFPPNLSKRKASVHFHEQMPFSRLFFYSPFTLTNVSLITFFDYYIIPLINPVTNTASTPPIEEPTRLTISW